MGYRSEVVLCMTDELKETLFASVNELQDINLKEEVLGVLKCATKYVEPGEHLFHWDWVKWYEDYPEISFIMSFLKGAAEEEFEFRRIGENSGDTEFLGDFYSNSFDICNVHTFDFKGKKKPVEFTPGEVPNSYENITPQHYVYPKVHIAEQPSAVEILSDQHAKIPSDVFDNLTLYERDGTTTLTFHDTRPTEEEAKKYVPYPTEF